MQRDRRSSGGFGRLLCSLAVVLMVEEPGKPSGVSPSAFGNEACVLVPNITFSVGGRTASGNDALVLAKLSIGGSDVSGIVAAVLESSKAK